MPPAQHGPDAEAPGGHRPQHPPQHRASRHRPSPHGWSRSRARLRRVAGDAGMTTAEYAVGTVAACGFAGVLYKLLTSGTVVGLLTGIVTRALSTVG